MLRIIVSHFTCGGGRLLLRSPVRQSVLISVALLLINELGNEKKIYQLNRVELVCMITSPISENAVVTDNTRVNFYFNVT